jgi:hypothetical protein
VGFAHGDGFHGRYIHWDGYPTHMGHSLWTIVKRDGIGLALDILCSENFGWSTINPSQGEYLDSQYSNDYSKAVAGYGIAYADSDSNEWIVYYGNNDLWGTEWAYIFDLNSKTMSIFKILGFGNPEVRLMTTINIDSDEMPDWAEIQQNGYVMAEEYYSNYQANKESA